MADRITPLPLEFWIDQSYPIQQSEGQQKLVHEINPNFIVEKYCIHVIEYPAYAKLSALNAELVDALEECLRDIKTGNYKKWPLLYAKVNKIEAAIQKAKGVANG